MEPEVDAAFRSFMRLRKNRPRARVAIRNAEKELRAVLNRWETAYNKENFYRGIRILLEFTTEWLLAVVGTGRGISTLSVKFLGTISFDERAHSWRIASKAEPNFQRTFSREPETFLFLVFQVRPADW
jgi:hypothetical protein